MFALPFSLKDWLGLSYLCMVDTFPFSLKVSRGVCVVHTLRYLISQELYLLLYGKEVYITVNPQHQKSKTILYFGRIGVI